MVVIGSLQVGRRLTVERNFVDGREVVVLIDGDYIRSFDLEVFGIAFTLEFAPEMLDMNFSLA